MAMAWLLMLLSVAQSSLASSQIGFWSNLLQLDPLSQLFNLMLPTAIPEARMSTLEIVRYYGYPVERHVVATDDGYLLELHRIPSRYNAFNGSGGGQPVLLQHGFLGSSSHFVFSGQTNSLALVLSDEGYDVWMGNFRGNTYSRRHLRLSADNDDEYWNFSLDEMAMLDLPATIDYVLQTTQRSQLTFIGHSMGSTTSAMFLSKRNEYCNKLKPIIWLGPVLYGNYAKTALRIFVSHHQTIRSWLNVFYGTEVFTAPKWLKDTVANACSTSTGTVLCQFVLFILIGFSEDILNKDYLPVVASHVTEGTSWFIIKHFIQIWQENKMQNFDWNAHNRYQAVDRTEYKLADISCPINAFWGRMDFFTDPLDFQRLAKEMKNVTIEEVLGNGSPYWNHLDFICSKDIRNNFYTRLLQLIRNRM